MGQRQFSPVPIARRVRLTDEMSEKQTFHLELDLSQTDIIYSVGDCLAVLPENDPHFVHKVLQFFSEPSTTSVTTREGETLAAIEFLTARANLTLTPKKLVERFGPANYLTELLPRLEGKISLMEFCSYLAPITPRFYSIASSMSAVGKMAHLTVTLNRNPPDHPLTLGTCSDYLCHRAVEGQSLIAVAHHPARQFGLHPLSYQKPIIMIGPGTGVAPFRGFMQERLAQGACSKNWLFFGERTSKGHYYYREEWELYAQKGHLQLDLAFSRDESSKVYVQDKMREKAASLWQWLHHEEGYLFVCGDAQNMAKAVDQTLHLITQEQGNMSCEQAKEYIKILKKQNRYLRDIY
ncbi:MAG: hypothetical protein JSS62_00235 [Verrucomicrobia bacterium]|nr:hypothetical protein [Verrucomicrobiota bacterium]MBS0646563.1 hypothetical protein [Verrucomicrobiota bacterium]